MNVTFHGTKRVRKRIGLPKRSVGRTVAKALVKGIRREDVSGSLRRYLDLLTHKTREYGKDPLIVIHANNVYIFTMDHVLITVWPLPSRFRYKKATRHG